ncbi:ribonuclease III domain-containing protein [Ephemerocybe angulata]|uniref:Ribonuclease III domain-containing protein n=1 Tax=Ephemerocybe angulata TaxID=980116 RepID=A0A8H6MHY8_9AGAR|nr:ribonuclease III domain-containing protein [Tulosesus angulatus]
MNFVLQAGSSHLPPPAYHQLDQKLKRGRPRDGFKFNPALAPKLPSINSIDILLQVFTHPSIRPTSPDRMDTNDYSDNERLTFLGELTLSATVTDALFRQRPMLSAQEITAKRQEILLDESFDDWVTHYKLLGKLRCDLGLRSTFSINNPQETRAIFHAYVGGLYVDSGSDAVYAWIAPLIGQYLSVGGELPDGEPMVVNEMLNRCRCPHRPIPPQPQPPHPIFFGSQPPPSPVRPPSHLQAPPMGMPRPNPLAPAQPSLPFLPLAQFAGPSHAGTWVVRCIVNGIPKGEGKGSSKQTAKEEAARQAFYAMGWT